MSSENNSDLMVLVHGKHSLLEWLFHTSNTKSLLETQEFPIMIIPEGMVAI